MHGLRAILLVVAIIAAGAFGACSAGTDGDSTFNGAGATGGGNGGGGDSGSGATPGIGTGATGGSLRPPSDAGEPIPVGGAILAMRVDPPEAVLDLAVGQQGIQAFRVLATLSDTAGEQDITSRSVFYLADNPELGGFADNGPEFRTNAESPRGGRATVRALASNPDGSTSSADATVTVKFSGALVDGRPGIAPVPPNASELFADAPSTGTAQRIVYPNDGTLLPPNLNRLAIHFRPLDRNNLFELAFSSATASIKYHVRCGTPIDGGCAFELDRTGYTLIAQGSRGSEVEVALREVADTGGPVAASAPVRIAFADSDVRGAVYYWMARPKTDTEDGTGEILRFEFGTLVEEPEVFLRPGENGLRGSCVGCHALSRDGTKMIASVDGQHQGFVVYVDDLSRPKSAPDFLLKSGQWGSEQIQFASFNPDGSRIVAVFGDTDDLSVRNKLWMLDGATSLRIPEESIALSFEPDHPDWSPDGNRIALTHVGEHRTSQWPIRGGIDVIERTGAGWGAPITVIPAGSGKSSFNPNFLPDSELLVYNQAICPGSDDAWDCNGDDDPTATVLAVQAASGASAITLRRANSGGIEDRGDTTLHNTFPRSSPFVSRYAGRDIYWVTISSRRRAGLLNGVPPGESRNHQLLWMFAVDPASLRAGMDGSYPAFFLPFQDFTTSNHIAQWTKEIVSDNPPPRPPPVGEPPKPPPVTVK